MLVVWLARILRRGKFAGLAAVLLAGPICGSVQAVADAYDDAFNQAVINWEHWTETVYHGDDCDKYAAQAQQDMFLAERLSCVAADPADFSPPRWQESVEPHASWCRAHGHDPSSSLTASTAMQYEEQLRQDYLRSCDECAIVAKLGVDQVKTGNALHCGFSGTEWAPGIVGQLRACFANNKTSQPGNLYYDRDKKVQACRISARSRIGGSPPTSGPGPRIPQRP